MRLRLGLLAVSLIAAACGGPSTPQSPFGGKAKVSDGAGKPEADVAFDKGPVAQKGASAKGTVTVRPKSPWHINVEFPVKLELTASDGVTLSAPTQAKIDARRYDDDALVFEVPYRVDVCGAHEIKGNVDFALCRDEACAPVTEPVTVAVSAC